MRAAPAIFVQRRPQDIAGMAVAVQADQARVLQARWAASTSATSAVSYQFDGFVALLAPTGLHVQRGPVDKRLCGAHGVDARQKAANPLQHFGVVQLGLAAAAPGADREGK